MATLAERSKKWRTNRKLREGGKPVTFWISAESDKMFEKIKQITQLKNDEIISRAIATLFESVSLIEPVVNNAQGVESSVLEPVVNNAQGVESSLIEIQTLVIKENLFPDSDGYRLIVGKAIYEAVESGYPLKELKKWLNSALKPVVENAEKWSLKDIRMICKRHRSK